MKLRALTLLAAGAAAACGGSGQPGVAYPVYRFTCCTAADVNQVWHAGATVDLHWIVQSESPVADSTPHPVVLSAVIVGPFPDVTTLKKSGGATDAVQGSVVRTDDRTPSPAPVSEFFLPANLPAGLYNLEIKVDFGGGNSMSSGSIVRVGSG